MRIIWQIFCSINAVMSATDSMMAISEFDHPGDMHISWAYNSGIAALVFLAAAFYAPLRRQFVAI